MEYLGWCSTCINIFLVPSTNDIVWLSWTFFDKITDSIICRIWFVRLIFSVKQEKSLIRNSETYKRLLLWCRCWSMIYIFIMKVCKSLWSSVYKHTSLLLFFFKEATIYFYAIVFWILRNTLFYFYIYSCLSLTVFLLGVKRNLALVLQSLGNWLL